MKRGNSKFLRRNYTPEGIGSWAQFIYVAIECTVIRLHHSVPLRPGYNLEHIHCNRLMICIVTTVNFYCHRFLCPSVGSWLCPGIHLTERMTKLIGFYVQSLCCDLAISWASCLQQNTSVLNTVGSVYNLDHRRSFYWALRLIPGKKCLTKTQGFIYSRSFQPRLMSFMINFVVVRWWWIISVTTEPRSEVRRIIHVRAQKPCERLFPHIINEECSHITQTSAFTRFQQRDNEDEIKLQFRDRKTVFRFFPSLTDGVNCCQAAQRSIKCQSVFMKVNFKCYVSD